MNRRWKLLHYNRVEGLDKVKCHCKSQPVLFVLEALLPCNIAQALHFGWVRLQGRRIHRIPSDCTHVEPISKPECPGPAAPHVVLYLLTYWWLTGNKVV